MKPYKINYHMHSTFSPDAKHSVAQMVRASAEAGLDEICFTDHVECNGNAAIPAGFDLWPEFDLTGYIATVNTYRIKTENTQEHIKKPIVKIGIELGQATQNKGRAEQVLAAYEWDFVLGSLHNLKDSYDFYYLGQQGVDMRPLMRDYFEQLYELAVYNRFSVLSHLYYPIKYIAWQGLDFDMAAYGAEISDIFRVLIQNGKGIEVNTSALRSPYSDTVPSLEWIKLYRRLGGQIITVGSDCHHASAVYLGIEQALDYLRYAGFTAVTIFEKQQPIFKDI